MDDFIVQRWNETVKPSDHVYHLGDVALMRRHISTVKRCNGHKRLIWGNHDIYGYKDYAEAGFEKLFGSRVLANILFTHIPVHPGSVGRFRANVHGHIHTNRSPEPVLRIDKVTQKVTAVPYVNVCVEVTNYRPLSLGEIEKRIDEESIHS